MGTDTFQNSPPSPDLYRTDELQTRISSFLHDCRARNLSGGTLEFYTKKLKAFAGLCLANKVDTLGGIHADLIRHFLIMLSEKGHRPAGVHCYYRTVKTFLKWYERKAELENW